MENKTRKHILKDFQYKNISLFPSVNRDISILLNKEICKKLNCKIGDSLSIELKKETAKYGLPISEEMEEVLYSDPDGTVLFNKLTPGKQRTLIHIVNKIKSTNLKIERSFVIIEHIKKLNGNLDYELLQQDFKDYRNKLKF